MGPLSADLFIFSFLVLFLGLVWLERPRLLEPASLLQYVYASKALLDIITLSTLWTFIYSHQMKCVESNPGTCNGTIIC